MSALQFELTWLSIAYIRFLQSPSIYNMEFKAAGATGWAWAKPGYATVFATTIDISCEMMARPAFKMGCIEAANRARGLQNNLIQAGSDFRDWLTGTESSDSNTGHGSW